MSGDGRVGGWTGETGDDPLGGAGLLVGAISRWLAEARVDDAARARARQRWLEQQAAEGTSVASVLVDLGERRRPVLVQTGLGRRHRGLLVGLGVDFVAIRTDAGAEVLVATRDIHAVRTRPGEPGAHSGRAVTLDAHLADAIAALAADRPRVTVATGPDATFKGELVSVGLDVLTLRVDGDARTNVYVPIDAVAEIATSR